MTSPQFLRPFLAALLMAAVQVASGQENQGCTQGTLFLVDKDLPITLASWQAQYQHMCAMGDASLVAVEARQFGPIDVNKDDKDMKRPLSDWSVKETDTWEKVDYRQTYRGGSRVIIELSFDVTNSGILFLLVNAREIEEAILNKEIIQPRLCQEVELKNHAWGDLSRVLALSASAASGKSQKLRLKFITRNQAWNEPAAIVTGLGSIDQSMLRQKADLAFPRKNGEPMLEYLPQDWLSDQDGKGIKKTIEDAIKDFANDPGAAVIQTRLANWAVMNGTERFRLFDQVANYAVISRKASSSLAAIEAKAKRYGSSYPAKHARQALQEKMQELRQSLGNADAKLTPDDLLAFQQKWLIRSHPKLSGQRILFVKRQPYAGQHYYDTHMNGVQKLGADLCVLDIDSGQVSSVLPYEMRGGWIDRFDLDFDAKHVVFSYRPPESKEFLIHELDLNSGKVVRITQPSRLVPTQGRGGTGYGDIHPCYLADGDIIFASTRIINTAYCGPDQLHLTGLYRIKRNGEGLESLSPAPLSEMAPSMLDDGRILFNRWEYVYKNVFDSQPLSVIRPDGTNVEEIYGGQVRDPFAVMLGRQIPGNPNLVVGVGCGHGPNYYGSIGIIDLRADKRSPKTWQSLTPEVAFLCNWGSHSYMRYGKLHREQRVPLFCDPWPLDAETFLVSHKPFSPDKTTYDADAFSLTLLDTHGNRVTLLDDDHTSLWQPVLYAPRERPRVLPSSAGSNNEAATVFIADVNEGLTGVERGTIRYLRILEQVRQPWKQLLPDYRGDLGLNGHGPIIGNGTAIWAVALHGVVPVDATGSATFNVMPNRALFFQVLDENYKSLHTMRTWVSFRPKEARSCVGCHDDRRKAPPTSMTLRKIIQPELPVPQPGDNGPRAIHYPSDVQPIWDRHCLSCHGSGNPKAQLDLSATPTAMFNASYENLLRRGMVSYIQEFGAPNSASSKELQQGGKAESLPEKSWGAMASPLVALLEKGHKDVKLTREEMIRVITWIDAGSPFYGSYLGTRDLKRVHEPNFRTIPDFKSATDPLGYMAENPERYPQVKKE